MLRAILLSCLALWVTASNAQTKRTTAQPQTFSREQLYQNLAASVVTIETERGSGTGFYDSEGYLYTAYHVVEGCTKAKVVFQNGKTSTIFRFLGVSAEADVAVLIPQTNTDSRGIVEGGKIVPFSSVKVGQSVFIIGTPRGLHGTFTEGMVSAKRSVEGTNIIQYSAAIDSGSSGSPIFNERGEIIGMVTSMIKGSQGLNFAISGDELAECYGVMMPNVQPGSANDAKGRASLVRNPIVFDSKSWSEELVLTDLGPISVLAEDVSNLGISGRDVEMWTKSILIESGVPITTRESQRTRYSDANHRVYSDKEELRIQDEFLSYLYITVNVMRGSDMTIYNLDLSMNRAGLIYPGFFESVVVWNRKFHGFFGRGYDPRTRLRELVQARVRDFIADYRKANPNSNRGQQVR